MNIRKKTNPPAPSPSAEDVPGAEDVDPVEIQQERRRRIATAQYEEQK
ncbi:hypothetical protein F441_22277 [Phytophthora nicotianae CJ01A1]|uniref:Uncharacterized protein n=2 Tax=Phytophthora nicotianae TaxID=4792 RepID=W2VRM8_PHYNI|nr:hypothetical protein L916_21739 [Phytophthora nicotianae]ETP00303.1 hypothetical protein F441_22277 [Phytophthora nicotianae CJ01A1]